MKKCILAAMIMICAVAHGQTIMRIHQNNGTVLQIPLNTIDSITYTNSTSGSLATLTTIAVTNITPGSAIGGGNITGDGGSPVTQRGICWATTPNPTISGNTSSSGMGVGVFNANVTGLSPNTTYYIRAYAINSTGTAYGNEIIFKSLPSIPLPPNGELWIIGAATNSLWENPLTEPFLTDQKFKKISDTKYELITPLKANSPYLFIHTMGRWDKYVMEPGIDSKMFIDSGQFILYNGTGETLFLSPSTEGVYKITLDFTFGKFTVVNTQTFNGNLTYGNVTDVEGNSYKTIQIGTQEWMAENLRTSKYGDGSDIPVVSDSIQWANNWNNGNPLQKPMMCWYNNDSATYRVNKFGALYNWYAINPPTNGNKNVCPTGWHMPTDSEWTTLITFLGGESVAGGKMKSTGTQYWISPNTGATNSSGLSGLPGGVRYLNGPFDKMSYSSYWWSSTKGGDGISAWYRGLDYNSSNVARFVDKALNGFSVRCIRD